MSDSSAHDGLLCSVAIGAPTGNLGKVTNRVLSWSQLRKRLSECIPSPLSVKQYAALALRDKNTEKNRAGFWLGGPCDNGVRAKKNIAKRSTIALDLDAVDRLILDKLMLGLTGISEYEFFLHSTRSHKPEAPRLRIVLPLREPISADKFTALARIVAQKLDTTMDSIDDVSFRLAQMMYFPTRGKNQEFITHHNPGELLDGDAVLTAWGPWENYDALPYSEVQGKKRQSAEKAEDPRDKVGIVGAFCRAFTVEDAMAEFIPGVYEPTDDDNEKPRYTFTGGHGYSGAVVEDDGLFLYSHHGTDPCSERLVNAFDMCRIHLFGDLADDEDETTPMGKRASFVKMAKVAAAHPTIQEGYTETALDDLDDSDDVGAEPTAEADGEALAAPAAAVAQDDDPEIEALLGGATVWRKAKPAKLPKPKTPIEELNRRHAVVNSGGTIVILNIPPENDRETEETFSKVADVNLRYANRTVPEGPKTIPLAQAWINSPERRQYLSGLVFDPGRTDLAKRGFYNLWRGFAVDPDPRPSCEMFLDHLRRNICRGDQSHFDYLFGFLAHIVQFPHEKPGVAIVLRGGKGVGKDTLGDVFGLLFPRNHVKVGQMEQLTGKFNGHMERALLLHVEEGIWAGDRSAHGPLQNAITAPKMRIERKNIDSSQKASFMRVLITSNETWVVPATRGERRYFVLDVGDDNKQDTRFFRDLHRQMEHQGGLEKLLWLLQHHDLSNFNVRDVPNTEGLLGQQVAGLKNVEAFWFEILINGSISYEGLPQGNTNLLDDEDPAEKSFDWSRHPLVIGKILLHDIYLDWMKQHSRFGHGVPLNRKTFGSALHAMCPGKRGNAHAHGSDGRAQGAHRFPLLSDCRGAFETFLSEQRGTIPIDWSAGDDVENEQDDIAHLL